MTQSITGLATGLDTASIISQLVSIERNTQNIVKARATRAQVQLSTWAAIRSQVGTLRTATQELTRPGSWLALSASSSNEAAATVNAGTGTFGGSVTFTVDALARAGSARSANVLGAPTDVVAADDAILVAAAAGKLGFATLASDDTLALGNHTITVTQASAAAEKSGDAALAASTVIDGSNNTLAVSVHGVAKVLTIANGTYDRTQLAAAVQAAADAAGADLSISLDATTNTLALATAREGSAASLQVTGGNATAALVLSVDGAAITGTDGKLKVGDAAEQTVTSVEAGGTITLAAGAGTIEAVLAGGLRTGSVVAENVTTGDGSLAAVVANINAANAGVVASAVKVAEGAYRLQISAKQTGALNGSNVAESEFGAAVGGFVELSAASDASLTIGDGPGAYTVTSASNTVTDLLPGATVTLKSESASPVTITLERDVEAFADKVQALVDAANALKKSADAATAFNAETRQASPLTGDSTVRRLVSSVTRALTDAVGWANPGSPGLAGLSTDKTGAFTFDRSKFVTAFNDDPEGAMRVFTQGGSATDAAISFVTAGDRARAGTYDVNVTQAATQARSIGLDGTWPIGSPPTVKVKIGSEEVSYAVGASDLQADVVTGLNAAFRSAGFNLVAEVSGGGIDVHSVEYGANATFSIAWDGATFSSVAGLDVEGTIDGVTGTGIGRQLTIPFDHEYLGGLSLNIETDAAGALGTFTYQPGSAQRLSTALLDATDAITGYVTSAEKTLKARIDFVNDQVESMEQRLIQYEARLKRQYATLETVLSTLQQQSNWLAGQVANMNAQS